MRQIDIEQIIELLYVSRCVEVTGFSNVGKSSLLRLLAQGDVWLHELGEAGSGFLPVYIDCNRMLEMTDQGFYELVLRCLQESIPELAADDDLCAAYETLVAPASVFQVPLSFSKGLTAALQNGQHKLVLLFDEFDEPFQQIDSRVFLNLRAKKDRHGPRLVYVTATMRPLAELRPGDHCGEFCELFVHQPWHLAPLTRRDVDRYIHSFAQQNETDLTGEDTDFVYQWTGGHPGYLAGVIRILGEALAAADVTDPEERWQVHRSAGKSVRRDPTLRTESEKVWQTCTEAEQEALRGLFTGAGAEPGPVAGLLQGHILVQVDGEPKPFSRLFAEYVQSYQVDADAKIERLYVDSTSGEVFVDGRQTETLTRLEYQLMLLLFENADKIVDKYQIVTDVWGEDYLDDVDDARIEKLISRLRQKVEPDPSTPQFITTVRGRGYRLLLG